MLPTRTRAWRWRSGKLVPGIHPPLHRNPAAWLQSHFQAGKRSLHPPIHAPRPRIFSIPPTSYPPPRPASAVPQVTLKLKISRRRPAVFPSEHFHPLPRPEVLRTSCRRAQFFDIPLSTATLPCTRPICASAPFPRPRPNRRKRIPVRGVFLHRVWVCLLSFQSQLRPPPILPKRTLFCRPRHSAHFTPEMAIANEKN